MTHQLGRAYWELFRPPINRAMRILDKSFFRRTIPLAAADVFDVKNIPRVRRECHRDILDAPRRKHPEEIVQVDGKRRTLLLLRPGIKYDDDPRTLSTHLQFFLDEQLMKLVPYQMNLEYDFWPYDEILSAILPEDLGIPAHSYHPVGHIGNMHLKPEFHPYRHLIAEVLLSKTPQLKTVVIKPLPGPNDTAEIPAAPLEHLAGDPSTLVTLRETGCDFKFDYSNTTYDHTLAYATKQLRQKFRYRCAIAEVSAGIGTLTIPAAKKKHLVYANNPDPINHKALLSNIPNMTMPPVAGLIHATNLPARAFVRSAIMTLYQRSRGEATGRLALPLPHNDKRHPRPKPLMIKLPAFFDHFVVPWSVGGVKFLDAFRGAFVGLGIAVMPMIHVYTYHSTRITRFARKDIVDEIREVIQFPIEYEDVTIERAVEGKGATLHRASFILPREVAMDREETPKRKLAKERLREEKRKLAMEKLAEEKEQQMAGAELWV